MNLAEFLHRSADRHAKRPAVTDLATGASLAYADLAREARGVAAFVAAQGVRRGQRIALIAPNGMGYLAAAFGLLEAGACIVPIAASVPLAETDAILTEIEVHGCFVCPGTKLPARAQPPSLAPQGVCAGFAFHWIEREAPDPPGFTAMNPAFVRFTSGTTARARGVVLSHEATAARVAAADRVLGLSDNDRVLWVLPLAYHFAVTIVAYARAGVHVLMGADMLPRAIVEATRRHAATVLYASPLHFERMAGLGSSGPLASVRLAISTSAPIRRVVIDRFEALYGVPLGQAYGIIEAGLPCINTRADAIAPTSVGRPVPGYEVGIFSDAGERLPPGSSGEIQLRGEGLFSGYYSPWQLLDRITRDGWFATGDIGSFDDTGALHLLGRKKSLIFIGGLKFFPEEVEDCINRFPGIRESRVYARAHAHLGQVPCAEIVPQATPFDLDALRAHCARALSPYKVPVEFTVVDAVARSPGGKILRRTEGDAAAGS